MKRLIRTLCIAAAVVAASLTQAQNIPIGKRAPDVKPRSWLNDVRPVREAVLTCIEFYHPSSSRSLANIESLVALSSEFTHRNFQVMVVAAGDEAAVKKALMPFADEGIAIGLDRDNECFKAFGVNYLPSCIIIDDQRKIVWTGDSKSLTPQLIKSLNQK